MAAAQLTVTWTDNSWSEMGFKIERSTNGRTFSTVGIVRANRTSFTDSSLAASTTYWYRVKAYDLLRTSAYSPVVSAKTAATTTSTGGTTGSTGGTTGSTSGTTGSSGGTVTTGGTTTITDPVVTQGPSRIKAFTARAVTDYSAARSLVLSYDIVGGNKTILLRGIGPGLSAYTSAKILPDPLLKLYYRTYLAASNDNWGGTSTLVAGFKEVGAFPLPTTSKDSALQRGMGIGSYKTVVNGAYSGLAQTEIYDSDGPLSSAGRIPKLSIRAAVGTGTGVLVGGFVVAGDAPIKLLVRAIGPSLSDISTGKLLDPQLSVHRGGTLVAQNNNWGGSSTLASTFTKVGAPSLPSASKDSALLLTLSPGTYSTTVSGVSSTSGIARLEFYVVP